MHTNAQTHTHKSAGQIAGARAHNTPERPIQSVGIVRFMLKVSNRGRKGATGEREGGADGRSRRGRGGVGRMRPSETRRE